MLHEIRYPYLNKREDEYLGGNFHLCNAYKTFLKHELFDYALSPNNILIFFVERATHSNASGCWVHLRCYLYHLINLELPVTDLNTVKYD